MYKNPNYFQANQGLPYLDEVIFKFVDASTTISALLSGECDIADQTNWLDLGTLIPLEQNGSLNILSSLGTIFEHADFGIHPVSYDDGWQNGDRPNLFGDVRTRQAFAYCMDRQAVVDQVFFGKTIVMDSYLPPEHPLYNPNVANYPFDPATGGNLLNQAGWIDDDNNPATPRIYLGNDPNIPQGTPLIVDYWTTNATTRQEVTQILADSLAQCGIQANLSYWNPTEYFADGPGGPLFGRQFDIGQFAWLTGVEPPCDLWVTDGIPGDPNKTVGDVPWLAAALGSNANSTDAAFPVGWGGWNDPGYSNPNYDQACRKAMRLLPGQQNYRANHLLAQQIFSQELPIVPLFVRIKLAAARPNVTGFIMDATQNTGFWNIERFALGSPPIPPSGTNIVFTPNSLDIPLNGTTVVNVDITHISDLYGVQLKMSFDPHIVQVVDANPSKPGVQIAPGECPSPDFVVINNTDNTTGTIIYSATSLSPTQPCNTDGTLVHITFKGVSEGSTDLKINDVLLSDTNGTPILTSTMNGNIQVTLTCTFTGVIDLQGRTDDSGALFKAVGNNGGVFTANTNASGLYQVDVPGDIYNLTAEMSRFLDGTMSQVSCNPGQTVNLQTVLLLGGDANDSCDINILDLSFMGFRFMSSIGDPNYDSKADINGDGTINILDLTVAGANFNKTCPVAWP